MNCPFCNHNDGKVIDSRGSEGGKVIRRRRQCLKCGKRFTTYERIEQAGRLIVIKRDLTRVPFSRENVMRGVLAACGKRAIPEDAKLRLVDEVEEDLLREFDREVESHVIGERVMQRLRELDEVAFIRFASEHLKFKNIQEMSAQLEELKSRPPHFKSQQSLFDPDAVARDGVASEPEAKSSRKARGRG